MRLMLRFARGRRERLQPLRSTTFLGFFTLPEQDRGL
jgi:hypothetical protein